MLQVSVCKCPYLDVAGLFHKPAGVLCCSVAFRELDSEELESPLKVSLQEILLRRLEGDADTDRWLTTAHGHGGSHTECPTDSCPPTR